MKVLITSVLEDDIFGQYKATFLEKDSVDIASQGVYGGEINLQLSKGQSLTIETTAIRTPLTVGQEIDADGIFSIYAKNPDKGAVLSITKLN